MRLKTAKSSSMASPLSQAYLQRLSKFLYPHNPNENSDGPDPVAQLVEQVEHLRSEIDGLNQNLVQFQYYINDYQLLKQLQAYPEEELAKIPAETMDALRANFGQMFIKFQESQFIDAEG